MTRTSSERPATVKDLIQALKDNREVYRTAADNVISDELRGLFQERVQQRADFIAELEASSRPQDGESDNGDGISGIERGLMTVKAAMTIERDKTDEVVLEKCQQAEEKLLQSYRLALAKELPPGLQSQIERQYARVQAAYHYIDQMIEPPEETIVLGLFAETTDVDEVIGTLTEAGFSQEQISLLAQEKTVKAALEDDTQKRTQESAQAAALGGGTVGGLIGLVAGASMATVLGVGSVLSGGALAATLGVTAAGAGIGASYGGIFGALLGWGVAEDDTRRYVEGVRRGEILLAVEAKPERAEEAADILRRAEAEGITVRPQKLDKETTE
jgi:uncharacterized protein (TIGR02284 family)